MDVVVRLHRYLSDNIKAELPFIPDPVAWTEVPTNLRVLGRQREHGTAALLGTLITHRDMCFVRASAWRASSPFPFYLFGELLAPVVELGGYVFTLVRLALASDELVSRCSSFSWSRLRVAALALWAVLLELSFKRYIAAISIGCSRSRSSSRSLAASSPCGSG